MTTPIVELLNGVSAGENRNRSNQNFASLLQMIEDKGFVWQGDYIDSWEYVHGDIVKYNYSLYIAKVPTTGLIPTNTSAWDLLVQSFQGETGPTGPQGTGITSIIRTAGTGAPGSFDTYTITFSNTTTTTFQVWNGSNGTGDMNKTENLSGLANYTTARTNMGVYSKTEVDGLTHAASAKIIAVDADEFSLYDSAATFGLKRFTWANFKTGLKTYFDTLYQAALGYTAANDSGVVHNTGNENVNGIKTFLSPINRICYPILDLPGGDTTIVKLGRFTAPQSGARIHLILNFSNGYNSDNNQDTTIDFNFKTSNGSSVDVNGFAGNAYWYKIGLNGNAYWFKVVANAAGNSATYYDIYCFFVSIYNGFGNYEVLFNSGTWTHSGVSNNTDPGAPSSTICLATEIFSLYSPVKVNGVTLSDFCKAQFTTINSQTGTTYTFALTDAWSMVTFNNAAAQTITVPPNSSVAFPIGTQIDLAQLGAGKVTFAQGAGVTIQSKAGNKAISAQYVGASLKKIGTDTWLLLGDLIA